MPSAAKAVGRQGSVSNFPRFPVPNRKGVWGARRGPHWRLAFPGRPFPALQGPRLRRRHLLPAARLLRLRTMRAIKRRARRLYIHPARRACGPPGRRGRDGGPSANPSSPAPPWWRSGRWRSLRYAADKSAGVRRHPTGGRASPQHIGRQGRNCRAGGGRHLRVVVNPDFV